MLRKKRTEKKSKPRSLEDSLKFRKAKNDFLMLSSSPWPSGFRARAYHGDVSVQKTIVNGNSIRAIWAAHAASRRRCITLGCNALTGGSIVVDLFADKPYVLISGTAASLEKLY